MGSWSFTSMPAELTGQGPSDRHRSVHHALDLCPFGDNGDLGLVSLRTAIFPNGTLNVPRGKCAGSATRSFRLPLRVFSQAL